MMFTKKRKYHAEKLTLYELPMEKVNEFKYLGLWFDSKYSWKSHIKHLETKCKKVVNLLRAVAGCNWGADRRSLIDIYRACMRSSIDYGCVVYGAAAKTILEKINRLQYRALRVCIGAIKSTPINAILIEAGQTPLELRREKLALAYWIRLKGSGKENPTKESIQECWEYSKFQGLGFGWTREERVREYGMEALDFTMTNPVSNIPPWLFPDVKTDINILEKKREWRMEEVGVKTSIYLRHSYYNYLKIYTDGSKNKQECVGIGIYIPEFKVNLSKRLSDQLSVYTAEMVAAIIALQWVEEVRPDRVVLCTDSLAVIKKYTVHDICQRRPINGTSSQFAKITPGWHRRSVLLGAGT